MSSSEAPRISTSSQRQARHEPVLPGALSGSRTSIPDIKQLRDAPSVRLLLQAIPPVTPLMSCADVLNFFLQNASVHALPVVDEHGAPYALIERHAYIEFFSRSFASEVFGKKPLAQMNEITSIAAMIDKKPIVIDASTTIDDAAAIIIDAGMQHMISGFIVTDGGKYLGTANGYALLNHITQRKQAELHYLAHYDQLTCIPNRMLLADRLQMACREASRKNRLVGVIFVDLDRFKQINDTMGHCFGDQLLKAVAERLELCIRSHDTVARLGGDEFAILLSDLPFVRDAETTAQRIIDHFRLPFRILDHEVFITASLGIAIYPRDEQESENLLAKADAAMYEAKQSGRNAFRAYAPGFSVHSKEHLSLEADLRRAIGRDELVLHFQPQVDAASGVIVGAEALVRWQHPERGLLFPQVFIEIAEASGLIIDIGNWVLREACRQQHEWAQSGFPILRVAVNISAVQFRRSNFTETVRTIIQETGANPEFIELEMTENVAMHHADEVLNTLHELKRIGVKLAIDDFGTGFSNLSYLRHFPIDRLKIAQSFIRGIEHIPANKSIVNTIVSLAKGLGLETVAEGVETTEEFGQTKDSLCNLIQGYYHARPMNPADFLGWIQKAGDGQTLRLCPEPARTNEPIGGIGVNAGSIYSAHSL